VKKRKITPHGALTPLYSFCSQSGCADGSGPRAGLELGSEGNFYGTTYYGGAGDYNDGTVFGTWRLFQQIGPSSQTPGRWCHIRPCSRCWARQNWLYRRTSRWYPVPPSRSGSRRPFHRSCGAWLERPVVETRITEDYERPVLAREAPIAGRTDLTARRRAPFSAGLATRPHPALHASYRLGR
jgi:hypothetical protein